MAIRFQKRIRIAPGLRLNLSAGGVSMSAGPRGASLTLGKQGLYGNAGLPGTGISARQKLSPGKKVGAVERGGASSGSSEPVSVSLRSDGTVELTYESSGDPPRDFGGKPVTVLRNG